jgi:Ca2+-binding EF-hand superfamily protein
MDGYLIGEEIPGDIRGILKQTNSAPDTRLNMQDFLKMRETVYLLQVTANFKNHDRDEDGILQKHEMPLSLLKRLGKYSSKGDRVNFQEFLQYSRDRDFPVPPPPPAPTMRPDQGQGKSTLPSIVVDSSELESRPIVYRAGRLPKGLPDWFEKLDLDKDGQIALYEWRMAGYPIEDFALWDRNDDGFITFQEALRTLQESNAVRPKEN